MPTIIIMWKSREDVVDSPHAALTRNVRLHCYCCLASTLAAALWNFTWHLLYLMSRILREASWQRSLCRPKPLSLFHCELERPVLRLQTREIRFFRYPKCSSWQRTRQHQHGSYRLSLSHTLPKPGVGRMPKGSPSQSLSRSRAKQTLVSQ